MSQRGKIAALRVDIQKGAIRARYPQEVQLVRLDHRRAAATEASAGIARVLRDLERPVQAHREDRDRVAVW
jgi:hypothetical protein